MIRTSAVLGTGMMGPGIACTLALGGVRAAIVSRSAERAEAGVAGALQMLEVLLENGLAADEEVGAARERLSSTAEFARAVGGADLVVESIPEDMELKQALFQELDRAAPAHAILASNTSGLSITKIAERCARPERVVTTHFWNPPHLMPLVEIVRGAMTSEETVGVMMALWKHCGKVPVLVKKDRPGQLGNRMQMALVREAVNILQEGIADAEDIDTAAKLGFGIRLPAYGVLEHQDMVGLDLGFAVCDYVARDLNNEPKAPRLYGELMLGGHFGARTGRGFHDWSAKSPDEARARRDAFVISCLQAGIGRQRG